MRNYLPGVSAQFRFFSTFTAPKSPELNISKIFSFLSPRNQILKNKQDKGLLCRKSTLTILF